MLAICRQGNDTLHRGHQARHALHVLGADEGHRRGKQVWPPRHHLGVETGTDALQLGFQSVAVE